MTYSPFTQADLDGVVRDILAHSADLLLSKGQEYANDADRLGNFRRIGSTSGQSPEEVALTLLAKHIDSISQGVQKDVPFLWVTPEGKEGLKQRVSDALNYILLLAATLAARERARTEGA